MVKPSAKGFLVPNWCGVLVQVGGSPRAAAWVVAHAERLLTAIDPPAPLAISQQLPREGDGWRHWSMAHWGNKWDLQLDGEPQMASDAAAVWWEAPWEPPLAGLAQLADKFHEATIEVGFDEPGGDFAGLARFSGSASNPHDRIATWSLSAAESELLATLPLPYGLDPDDLEDEQRMDLIGEADFDPHATPSFADVSWDDGQGIASPQKQAAALADRLVNQGFEQMLSAACDTAITPGWGGAGIPHTRDAHPLRRHELHRLRRMVRRVARHYR